MGTSKEVCTSFTYSKDPLKMIMLSKLYTQESTSPQPGNDGSVTPAVSILQSTEQVVNEVASALPEDQNSFTISEPNIGTYTHLLHVL